MIMLKKIKKEDKYAFIAAGVSFFVYMLRICQSIDINISLDEIGTFASASALAGLDWSEILSYTRYYGYGFYWIYTVVFRITDNPYVIYIIIYIINCAVLAAASHLIYKIEVNELLLPNNYMTVLFAVLPGVVYSIVNYSYLSNDIAVYAGFWAVIFLICKLLNDTERKGCYSIYLAFCLCYLLTVHEKTIAVFGVVVFLLLVWRVFIKKAVVDWKKFICFLLLFYICARISKKIIIFLFWSNIKAETLANTSVIYTDLFWFLGDVQKFKILIDIFLSNIIKMTISTYGLFLLSIASSIFYLIFAVRKKTNIRKTFQQDPVLEKIIFVVSLSLAVILITMMGIAFQWGNGVWNKVNLGMEMGNSIRAYRYTRYYIIYVGPVFISLYKLCLSEKIQRKVFCFTGIFFACIISYFLFAVDGYLGEKNSVIEFASFFDKSLYDRFLSISFIIACVFLLGKFNDKKNQVIFCMIVCVLTIKRFLPLNMSFPQLECSRCGSTYKYILELEKKYDMKENIYLLESGNIGCYQFFLNHHTIQIYENEQQGIVLSNYNIEELEDIEIENVDLELLRNSRHIQLDENEHVFIL